jgi:hypothetical protein
VKILSSTKILISVDKSGVVLIHSIASGEFLNEIKLTMNKDEKIRLMEAD